MGGGRGGLLVYERSERLWQLFLWEGQGGLFLRRGLFEDEGCVGTEMIAEEEVVGEEREQETQLEGSVGVLGAGEDFRSDVEQREQLLTRGVLQELVGRTTQPCFPSAIHSPRNES
jgi:hypothetical protein